MLFFYDEEFVSVDVELCRVQQSLQGDQTNNLRADHWELQLLNTATTTNNQYICQATSHQKTLTSDLSISADLLVHAVEWGQLKVQDVGGHLSKVGLLQVPAHSLHLL